VADVIENDEGFDQKELEELALWLYGIYEETQLR